MSTWQPYYRRYKPAIKTRYGGRYETEYVRIRQEPPPPGRAPNGEVERLNDLREYRSSLIVFPEGHDPGGPHAAKKVASLVTEKTYNKWTKRKHLDPSLCLNLLVYGDYFNKRVFDPNIISSAIIQSQAGWSGSFGPDTAQGSVLNGDRDKDGDFTNATISEGNFDMGQMYLLAIAYAYYEQLTSSSREKLIAELLGNAKITRLNLPEIVSSGPLPDDWERAGYFKCGSIPPWYTGWGPGPNVKNIGETENHILTMLASRYLTNQLLYQRTYEVKYDNRRNSIDGAPSCTALVLQLLRNVLRGDFSEYNSKNYQLETRWALLTLNSYAYDDEVRLAARMVLDYLAAKAAASSSDLRRLVPFRRKNEAPKSAHDFSGKMQCGIGFVKGPEIQNPIPMGADPMLPWYALQSGNTRACEILHNGIPVHGMPNQRDVCLEIVSDYRIPDPIVDLIVNNSSRKFYQRLHRKVIDNDDPGQTGGNRNADNMELYAGSPSYLISAGGEAGDYAIDPRLSPASIGLILGVVLGTVAGLAAFNPLAAVSLMLVWGGIGGAVGAIVGAFTKGAVINDQSNQLGVAVTTSFIPAKGNKVLEDALEEALPGKIVDRADQLLIQFGSFSQEKLPASNGRGVANYGVAPDFACGFNVHIPAWLGENKLEPAGGGWSFANFGSSQNGQSKTPGFYLALFRQPHLLAEFAILESFDTLENPHVTYEEFKKDVRERNSNLVIKNNESGRYVTANGNRIEFVVWASRNSRNRRRGAATGGEVLNVTFDSPLSPWARGDAGKDGGALVNGSVLNTDGDAVITIDNPALDKRIRLDLSDMWNPRRTDENGVLEIAGKNHEVWTDFDWNGKEEGDVCRPFSVLGAAQTKVAQGGVIRMIPSDSRERTPIGVAKRFTLVAPVGQVRIGIQ